MLLDYLVSEYFVSFEVIFHLKFFSFLSKSVLLTILTCFNLTVKFSAVNLLNSGVVINLLGIYWLGICSQLH